MKVPAPSFLFRMVFVIVAVGICYSLGLRQGTAESNARGSSGPGKGTWARTAGPATGPKKTSKKFLPLAEAQEKVNGLAAKNLAGGTQDDAGYLDLLNSINPADIPGLVAELAKLPANDRNASLISEMLRRLTAVDPGLALAIAVKFTDPSLRGDAEINVLEAMALNDPSLALDNLKSLPPGNAALRAYDVVFASWAENDPAAAALAAASLAAGTPRDNALRGVAEAWAAADPASALNWALTLPVGDAAVLRHVMLGAAEVDPQLAAANLDKLNDPAARHDVIAEIAGRLAWDDPVGAVGWLNQVVDAATDVTYDHAVKQIFSKITEFNPALATALLQTASNAEDHDYLVAQMAKSWGGRDTPAALEWVASLPDSEGEARDETLRSLVAAWGKSDAAAAIQYVKNAADPMLFLPDIPALAQTLVKSDPQGAMAWVTSLPDGAAKDQALSNVLADFAHTDFAGAWNYALALPEGAGRDGVMVTLVSARVKDDPVAAVALLEQFSTQGPPFQNASRDLAYAWVRQDPQSVSEWINTLPDGAQRNGAIVQMVNYEASRDPASSLAWVNSMTNAQGRLSETQRLFSAWAKTDPVAALAALPSANIPPAQREALLLKIGQAQASAKSK